MSSLWHPRARDILKTLNVNLELEQEEAFFLGSRLILCGGGEGMGKSFMGALFGMCRAVSDAYDLNFEKPVLVWLVGADYEDARKEIEYLVGPEETWLDTLGILDRANSSIPTHKDQKVIIKTRMGITFETVSGYDPLKIGREQPHGIVGCEVSRWDKEVWDRVYGRLARKRGWGWFSGSFEGSVGWFAETYNLGQGPNEIDLRSVSVPTWANKALYPGGYDDPAIQQLRAQTSEARFMERFGGHPTPPTDNVLPEFRSILHVGEDAEYDSSYPVHLYVDPGYRGAYAVLYVQYKDVGGQTEIHINDEVYVTQYTHEQLIIEAQMKEAYKGVGTGAHVMDTGGNQMHMGNFSAVQRWLDDTGLVFAHQRRGVADQVDKLRSVLAINPYTGRPRLRIHPRCRGLISELGGGTSPVPGGGRWRMRNGKPEAKNDHASKALAYGLLMKYGAKNPSGAEPEDIFSDGGSSRVTSYLNKSGKSSLVGSPSYTSLYG
jgi:hypothetical protein